jgi:orotate phosphoribosyltransferase-like protein
MAGRAATANDLEVAREAARYLRTKNAKSEVAVRNYATGEAQDMSVERISVAWASRAGSGF